MSNKKIKKKIKKFLSLLFMSGVIVALLEFIHEYINDKPKKWVDIKSLDMRSYDNMFPNEIYLSDGQYFNNIYKNSFILSLHIKNTSDDEIVLSNLRADLLQHYLDFPIISASGRIEGDYFKVKIKNLSNTDIQDIDVFFYDENGTMCKRYNYNCILKQNTEDKDVTISVNINDINNKNNLLKIKPYIIINDVKGNMLKIEMNLFYFDKDSILFEQSGSNNQYFMIDRYVYDVPQNEIWMVNNGNVIIQNTEECIPPHETLVVEILVKSEVSCAFDLALKYQIDHTEFSEKEMSFVIYNPEKSDNIPEYFDEYIEIK